jgi:hypothetical protein
MAECVLSGFLRAGSQSRDTYPLGVKLYRKVIRENVARVFYSVFPIFCRKLTNEKINDLVDTFIIQHQATQPEFHQLATELLLFMRQQPEILTGEQRLIEYEWLVYTIEIDECIVPEPQIKEAQNMDVQNMEIIVNPTLRIVALPFLLKDGEPCYEDAKSEHYYALYRKHDNTLYQKILCVADVHMLLDAKSVGVTTKILKEKSAGYLTTLTYEQWLSDNNNDELLSIYC